MLVPAGRLTDTPAHTDWDGGDTASPRHTSLGRERKWSPERPRQTWGAVPATDSGPGWEASTLSHERYGADPCTETSTLLCYYDDSASTERVFAKCLIIIYLLLHLTAH